LGGKLCGRSLGAFYDVRVPAELILQAASYDDPAVALLTRLVQEFYVQIYGGPDSSPMLPGEFAPPQGAFLLGYVDGEPTAMGGWRFVPGVGPAAALRPVELKRMFVRSESRGRGFGRQTLRALEQSASDAGADWVLLQTGEPQVGAIALYRKAGYREVAPFGYFAGMPGVVHLGRKLPTAP
jgi:GNAT superfamily N-acetyltransferase